MTLEWGMDHQAVEAGLGPAFFLSLGIFLLVLLAISRRWMHETAAVLVGVVTLWLVTYIGGTLVPALHLLDFDEAMAAVDWNVIFLILGMMIFVAMFGETGVLRWLALRAFRLARGDAWLLGLALVLLAGLTSAFLNNVTAILLLVPMTIQIAQAVGVHPFVYVIPEVLAANIGGAATLIGDPPSTIVGSRLGLGFFEYMVAMAPVAAVCLVILVGLAGWLNRHDLSNARQQISPRLVAQLEAGANVIDRPLLRKTILVGMVTILTFLIGPVFALPLGVIALTGATWLMIWVRPNMQRMMREVDWTTLFFFIGIFILVGGLQEAGVLRRVGEAVVNLAGHNRVMATVLMVWVSGATSSAIDNIPYTIAALPVADALSAAVPGAGASRIFHWALILGTDLGANATYIGGAANIVAVGLLAQAGYRVGFGRFVRDGVLVTVTTLVVATIWLLIWY
jgi:Na+/H+ antiporter NhaD/arsenite permease-like protein